MVSESGPSIEEIPVYVAITGAPRTVAGRTLALSEVLAKQNSPSSADTTVNFEPEVLRMGFAGSSSTYGTKCSLYGIGKFSTLTASTITPLCRSSRMSLVSSGSMIFIISLAPGICIASTFWTSFAISTAC